MLSILIKGIKGGNTELKDEFWNQTKFSLSINHEALSTLLILFQLQFFHF